MTSQIINGYDASNYAFASGEYLIVTKNGVMTGSSPISGAPTNITIDGGIYTSGTYGLAFSLNGPSSGTADLNIRIGVSASIIAYQVSDIFNHFRASVVNGGSIIGTVGLSFHVSDLKFDNSGAVHSDGAGLSLSVSGTNAIVNSGVISGGLFGISSYFSGDYGYSSQKVTISNAGIVSGATAALDLDSEPDTVLNAGTMVGDVKLYGGNDVFDTTAGKVMGVISGGFGDDRIIGSAYADTIYGDNVSGDTAGGADILYGGAGDDVLNGGYGADALYGNQDNDVLYGNQDNDFLHGGQGDDMLFGGQGNDVLNGGLGNDTLSGNFGNDTFVYSAAGFGHDIITDLHQVAGDMDVVQLSSDVFASFADVQARATAVSSGTLLTDAAGDTILLVGVTINTLNAAMFTFT